MTSAALVTGATGFLGRAVVQELAEAGYRVQAVSRPSSDRAGLEPWVERWHEADIEDGEALSAVAQHFASDAKSDGAQASLVHSAALISYRTRDAKLAQRVNVTGTQNVLDACLAAGIPRVLHVSSVVAVGQAPAPQRTLDESAEFNGARLSSHYVSTKRAGEMLALAAPPELEVVAVNPGAIFGKSPRPSNTAFFVGEVLAGALGRVAPPGSLSVVGLRDTARGVRLALESGRDRRRYLLCESNWRMAELFALVRQLAGQRRRKALTLPGGPWRLAVGAARAWDRLRAGERVTPQSMALLGEHYRFDARRARSELGWDPEPFTRVLGSMLESESEGTC